MRRLFTLALFCLAVAVPAAGQQQPPPPAAPAGSDTPAPDQPLKIEEQVVVSASRAEQQLVNAPAAVSVVTGETIENAPATNVADLLRTVPGVNVAQLSARDINLTTRGATATLSTSQLALVDGRSIYQDFFGMVMWDLVPTSPHEIRQIEVIRGPASAVWGANAMTGVVNVITRTPRELANARPRSLTIGLGTFGRSAQGIDRDAGSLFYVNGSVAQAVSDRWAYKVSAGYFDQQPWARPVGPINNSFATPYPTYANTGTSQPKFDVRVDRELTNGARLTAAGGIAGTDGVIHSGLGPFDIRRGSRLTYASGRYQQGARRLAAFTNVLDGDATNLLSREASGAFLPLTFDTATFDVEAAEARTIGTRHLLTYGGNFRHNRFDISIAEGDNRNEGGVYLQDEIFLHDRIRVVAGARVDKFSSIDNAAFSPRVSLMLKPTAAQTVRLSYNRAFRAPSFINNNLGVTILNNANLSAISPVLGTFVFPIRATGNSDLKQETMNAYEIGYTGVVAERALVTASVYWNTIDDGIYFTQIGSYTPANPPVTWPAQIPTFVIGLIPPPGLPSVFTYRNLGTIKNKGLELGLEAPLTRAVNVFTNYSHQANPVVEGFDPLEVNFPANNRVNAGVNFSASRYLGNLSVNYTGSAYWQDVLDQRFAGVTDAFTLVNAGFGVRWAGERVVTSVKVINLTDEEVRQHIFADIMKRQIVGEVRLVF